MSDEQPTNEELDRLVERLGRDFTLSMYASRAHMEGDLEGQRRLAIMAINHLRSALAKREAVAEGFVLVPKEPTAAMVEAAKRCDYCWGYHESSMTMRRPDRDDVTDVWASMLAASQHVTEEK